MTKHIVTCVPNYLPSIGGAEVGMHAQLVALREAGQFRLSVVTATDDPDLPDREEIDGVEVHRYLRPRRSVRWYAPTLASLWRSPSLVARLRPDLVHLWYALPSGPGGYLGALRARVPVMMTLGGNDVADPLFPPPELLRRLGAAVARRSSEVICISTAARDVVVQDWGVHPDRVSVNPFGVDTSRFRPMTDSERVAARRRWSLSPSATVIVAVQRLERRKGVDVLLDALAAMPEPAADLVVLIAGRGRERAVLAERSVELGLAERVRFLGYVEEDQKVELLALADVHVLPSLYEGQGIVTAEAAASGTPSIATHSGGTTDMVDHMKTGLLVPPGDAAALGRALGEVVHDRTRLREWGAAARCKAEADLALERTTAQFAAVVGRLLG